MRRIVLLFLLCPFFLMGARAEAVYDRLGELSDAAGLARALPEEEQSVSGTLTLDGSYDVGGALSRLWESLCAKLRARLGEEIGVAASLLAVALVSACAAAFVEGGELRAVIDRVGCCAAALLSAGSLDGLLEQATEILESFSAYSRVSLPAVFTAAAASGAVTSASARYAAACLAMDVLMTASTRLVLPLIYLYIALAVSLSLYDNSILRALLDVSKWAVTTGLTVLTLAFGGYLSLTGLIAGSTDALAVKTAKTVLSRSLPIVGGLLSDSAAVLLSAASIVKNSLGAFALISVCALCVGPLTLYSVKLLVYRAVAASIGFLQETRLPVLVQRMGTAFGMLLGMIGCNACMLFLSIVSGIKVAAPT